MAILNGDDALLDTVTLPQRIVRCGQSEHCETRISDIVDHGVDGITCTVTTARDTYALTIPAPGEHMAYSASMAVAVGEELGLSREEIVRGVAAYEPTGSRMRVIRLPGDGCCWMIATTPIPSPLRRHWRSLAARTVTAGWRCWATWASWGT